MKKQTLSTLIIFTVLFTTAQSTFLIPNPSFENRSCCPSTFSQMSCVDNWANASSATSDFMDTCDYFPQAVPIPIPDGKAIVGEILTQNWKEYVGTCLPQNLISGVNYEFTIDIAFQFIDGTLGICISDTLLPPINITLYGDSSCSNFPYNTNNSCPIGFGSWQELGYVTVNPYDIENSWATYTISFTPNTNISVIAFGAPCNLPNEYEVNSCYPYFMFDNIHTIYTKINEKQKHPIFIDILPNPNNGKFLLKYNINENAEISIVSLSGKQVYSETLLNNSIKKEINLRNLQKGIYLVKIQTKNRIITKKIVIN